MTCDFYKDDSGEFYITCKQIGSALEYPNADDQSKVIHSRHRDRFDSLSFRYQIDTPAGTRETVVYTLRGAMEICRFSRQPFVSLYQAESVRWQLSLAACLRPAVLF